MGIVIRGSTFYGPRLLNSLPLDAVNAAAAYSIRKLRTDYAGACIEVNSLNNLTGTSKDVGFDSNGYIDVSELTGSDWYVTRWYDQSGNGLDFIQNTANLAPRISSAGTVDMVNGLVALYFDGVNDYLIIPSSVSSFNFLHNGTSSCYFSVLQFSRSSNPNRIISVISNINGTGNSGTFQLYRDDGSNTHIFQSLIYRGVASTINTQNNTSASYVIPNQQNLLYSAFDADNATASLRSTIQINNDSIQQNNTLTLSASGANAGYNMIMGRRSQIDPNWALDGYMQELIIYDTDQSANKTTLQNNINNYFSIY